mmetsp:Transcript_117915/g.380581  ORF Transcript_117915/g.380581 Transcript_117915/m.380581 type:complete len:330 (-) Transcript_117915:1064-2053(-)
MAIAAAYSAASADASVFDDFAPSFDDDALLEGGLRFRLESGLLAVSCVLHLPSTRFMISSYRSWMAFFSAGVKRKENTVGSDRMSSCSSLTGVLIISCTLYFNASAPISFLPSTSTGLMKFCSSASARCNSGTFLSSGFMPGARSEAIFETHSEIARTTFWPSSCTKKKSGVCCNARSSAATTLAVSSSASVPVAGKAPSAAETSRSWPTSPATATQKAMSAGSALSVARMAVARFVMKSTMTVAAGGSIASKFDMMPARASSHRHTRRCGNSGSSPSWPLKVFSQSWSSQKSRVKRPAAASMPLALQENKKSNSCSTDRTLTRKPTPL